MSSGDPQLIAEITSTLETFALQTPLPGVVGQAERDVLARQMVESIHRIRYVSRIQSREISPERANPYSDLFDPLKAAVFFKKQDRLDEAFWMVFLFVHFGKHSRAGWYYAKEVYGAYGNGNTWDWESTSGDVAAFQAWLDKNVSVRPTPSFFSAAAGR